MTVRYDALPQGLRDEYDRFEAWCTNYLCIQPQTMTGRIEGHVQRYLEWLHDRHDADDTMNYGASFMIQFLSEQQQAKKAYMQKFRQSLRRFLEWQYTYGHVTSDDLTKYNLVKLQVKHWESKHVRALTKQEIAYVFRRIEHHWPYDMKTVYRFAAGQKIGGRAGMTKLRASIMNRQMYAAIRMVLECGLRFEELFTLTLQQVDPANQTIWITGKGSKKRMVPYPASAREAMRVYLAHRKEIVQGQHDKLWVSMRGAPLGRPVSQVGMRRRIDTIFSDQIDAGWHILRKTFATVTYKVGQDLGALAKVLGHESIKTTQIYLDLDNEGVLEEAQAFEGDRSAYFDSIKAKVDAEPKLNRDRDSEEEVA